MRVFHELVFDDGIAGAVTVYTPPTWDQLLGLPDSLTIYGYATNVTAASGTPTLTIQVEHSADQRRYLSRNTVPEINGLSIATGVETGFIGNDGNPVGANRLGFARLKITLAGSTPVARVRIYVTGRGEQVQSGSMG